MASNHLPEIADPFSGSSAVRIGTERGKGLHIGEEGVSETCVFDLEPRDGAVQGERQIVLDNHEGVVEIADSLFLVIRIEILRKRKKNRPDMLSAASPTNYGTPNTRPVTPHGSSTERG